MILIYPSNVLLESHLRVYFLIVIPNKLPFLDVKNLPIIGRFSFD